MLTIATSSRSLFDLQDANALFEKEGQKRFDEFMRDTESQPLAPGPAFSMVRKLLALNDGVGAGARNLVEVVLLSRNSTDAGMRVMNSVHHHGLDIEQAFFTSGADRFKYAQAAGADLFLSASGEDSRKALENGLAAATMAQGSHSRAGDDSQVRIALDGDSVLFDDSADVIYRASGLTAFRDSELLKAGVPMGAGPFKNFLGKLCHLQKSLPDAKRDHLSLALFTARGVPSHGRPINTLRSWDLTINECFFLAGKPKGPLLAAYGADMFFDDTGHNIQSAAEHGVPAGHVHTEGGGGIVRLAA